MNAPHLPSKTCSIKMHQTMMGIPWFVSVILVAFLSGVSAALATIVWIAPNVVYDSSDVVVSRTSREIAEVVDVDPAFVHQVQEQVVRVYNQDKIIGKIGYNKGAFVSDAVLLSSDGWSVVYRPEFRIGEEIKWQGVGYQGNIYSIEKVKHDEVSGLLYIKWQGNGFHIASFPERKEVTQGRSGWAVSYDEWRNIEMKNKIYSEEKFALLSDLRNIFIIDKDATLGNFVISNSGELLGFVSKDKRTLVSSQFVQFTLQQILESEDFVYKRIPVEGKFINGFIKNDRFVDKEGFFVTKQDKDGLFEIGDIILSINNQPVSSVYLGWDVLFSGEDVGFGVLRDGEELMVNF